VHLQEQLDAQRLQLAEIEALKARLASLERLAAAQPIAVAAR
jgi:hypothetical protein